MNHPEYFIGHRKLGGIVGEDSFAEARENCVLATVDVMPVRDGREAYLGYRSLHPNDYWWIFGGRMFLGEEYAQSAFRAIERELKITEVETAKLHLLGFYSLYWNQDAEIDHALLVGHSYDIRLGQQLPVPEGHLSAKWFEFDEILSGEFHPCIKQMVSDYRSLQ